MESSESDVATFFQGRSIFITGATGFLGKCILEKLLRSCPEVNNVYVLMRPRRGDDIETRMTKLREDVVFERIQHANPNLLQKLIAVPGDVALDQLGISDNDWKIICTEVTIVIHAAAMVKFDENLKNAVNMNVKGTQRVIDLCKNLTAIQALVHVSTAYSNSDRQEIGEQIYSTAIPVHRLLDKIDSTIDDELKGMTRILLNNRPNTYTYTKAMAENILWEQAGQLPICIIRPSIVTGAWKEPMQGWVFGMNGPAGLIAAWAKGILRTFFADESKVADFIPVDFCTNLILAAAYSCSKQRKRDVKVYNCCSGTLNPVTWGRFKDCVNLFLGSNPSNHALRAPKCSFTKNRVKHGVHGFLAQTLPAQVASVVGRLQGKEDRILQLFKKLEAASKAMEFFTTHDWKFATNNMETLYEELSDVDKELFYFDVRQISWPGHFKDYCSGIKRYILKEI